MDTSDVETLKELVEKEIFHLVIRKKELDVFTNPNTIKLLDLLRPDIIVVFGVTLEVCVYQAVSGMLRWNKAEIIVLRGAVKGFEKENEEKILKEFEAKGVKVKKLNDLRKGILSVVT